jgi:hypothetical protein
MQLVAYGAQDLYLTGTPEITYWRAITKRHTNFSVESIEQVWNGAVAMGKRVSCTVSRNGDLVNGMFLEISMKQTGPTWYPAEAVVKELEFELGGQKIDRHYSDWFRIYDELFRTGEQKAAYKNLTNFDWTSEQSTTESVTRKLYLPLIFFFNKEPAQALSLVSLQFHEAKLHLTTASSVEGIDSSSLDIKLFADFVFLDVAERKKFASTSTEALIEQLQYNGAESKGATSNNIRLTFNHPVKYLVWNLTAGKHGLYNLSAPNGVFGTKDDTLPTGESDIYNDAFAPVKTAKLQLNGHDRFSERAGTWFSKVVPYQCCGSRPQAGLYMYSFALHPGRQQPSGTCNFSRIDNATLNLTYKTKVSGAQDAANVADGDSYGVQWSNPSTTNFESVHTWAVNYNVLRIVSGMGGLAFSN